jgi:hypothetical protein
MLKYEKEQDWLKISERCKRPTVEIDISNQSWLRFQCVDESIPVCERVNIINNQKVIDKPVYSIIDKQEDYDIDDTDKLFVDSVNLINYYIDEELEEDIIIEEENIVDQIDITMEEEVQDLEEKDLEVLPYPLCVLSKYWK